MIFKGFFLPGRRGKGQREPCEHKQLSDIVLSWLRSRARFAHTSEEQKNQPQHQAVRCPKLPERWQPQGNGGPGWENKNSPRLLKQSKETLSSSVHRAPAAETKMPRSPRSRALYSCLFLNKRCPSVLVSSLGQARRLQNLRG